MSITQEDYDALMIERDELKVQLEEMRERWQSTARSGMDAIGRETSRNGTINYLRGQFKTLKEFLDNGGEISMDAGPYDLIADCSEFKGEHSDIGVKQLIAHIEFLTYAFHRCYACVPDDGSKTSETLFEEFSDALTQNAQESYELSQEKKS